MLSFFELTMVISIDQSTTNDRLKPVLTAGLVNTHIDRSIANPGGQGGCDRRIEVFGKIQKKKNFF